MSEVWQCGTWAVDGGGVHFIAATEAVALEWLEARRVAEVRSATRANARPEEERLVTWPVLEKLEPIHDGTGYVFHALNDDYYARRVVVHTSVPEGER